MQNVKILRKGWNCEKCGKSLDLYDVYVLQHCGECSLQPLCEICADVLLARWQSEFHPKSK